MQERRVDENIREVVERWEIEHEQMKILGSQVLKKYSEGEIHAAQRVLEAFSQLVKSHFKDEHLRLLGMMQRQVCNDEEMRTAIQVFRSTFQGLQREILQTLLHYTHSSNFDSEFSDRFSHLLDTLDKRIDFEETSLYRLLKRLC